MAEPAAPPRGEVAAMVAVQSALADRPGVLTTARVMSHFGEHSVGWLAVSLLGAVLVPRRRREWLLAGAGSVVAHAAAVLVKRLVRRRRPHHPAIAVNVGTPSQLSFPSAHATSTTAAAILMGRAAGLRSVVAAPAALVPPMALSRILLGVHYPSDVAVGVALGAVIAALAVSLDGRMPDQDVRRRGGAQPAAGPNTAPNTRGAAG
ncbi:phosphatase PAP2 family protein [Mycobacterium shinjukuense]|uniref:Putative decaprenylphosphoryl-5-phosphoribose phosphatase n=1 Tax=Mycobacterium shinjukuense TaxID=398694 RepID=A0A7I7MUH4_9MYCO|nr:phosphatase PAP2 family protein [Mycobacterium shinjukuense]MCV6986551.1 phosphatase PAP2 family protein [Mycobacterium shinjukuense]BBX75512.1 putative decaprenylphosphoryl-5-phosphoribose phosphatase [Mycobacterium shinjukuense]